MSIRDWCMILAGQIALAAVYALWTDSLGLDGYVAWVIDNWVPGRVSVPIAIWMLLGAFWIVRAAPKPEEAGGGAS